METTAGELLESLAHFAVTKTLQPYASPLQITLTLVPDVGVTSMDVDIKLLDPYNQVLQPSTVNWINESAAAIQVGFSKVEYDPASGKVIYAIENKGQEKVEGLQMRYTNISGDAVGKAVLLDKQDTATIDVGAIDVGGSSGEQSLEIDFKGAKQARFKFELLHEGKVLVGLTQERDFGNFSAEALQALFSAIGVKNVDKVKQLLAEGNIDLNGTDKFGDTPLREALQGRNLDGASEQIIQALLDHGADSTKINKNKYTYLHIALLGHNTDETIMKLLKAGVDINAQDFTGDTPLYLAAAFANTVQVELLLKQGARRDIRNNQGKTPADIAAERAANVGLSLASRAEYEKIRQLLTK